jgi:hypothetical protein
MAIFARLLRRRSGAACGSSSSPACRRNRRCARTNKNNNKFRVPNNDAVRHHFWNASVSAYQRISADGQIFQGSYCADGFDREQLCSSHYQKPSAAQRRVLLDRLDGDETRLPPGLMSALEAKRTCWDGVITRMAHSDMPS